MNTAYNEERTAFLEFLHHPYFSVHYGLVVNTGRKNINAFNDILDKSIAVEDGFWMQNWFAENHPKARLVPLSAFPRKIRTGFSIPSSRPAVNPPPRKGPVWGWPSATNS